MSSLVGFKNWCGTLSEDLQDKETSIKMAKIVFGLPVIAVAIGSIFN